MALPSNIPTSFVPHATTGPRKFRTDLTGAFDLVAYLILGIVFILALGVFFYGRVLASSQVAKDTELAKAEEGIDPMTVQNFVRLRDRLANGQELLSNHVAVSKFFALLETLVPTTVRMETLHLAIIDAGVVKLEGKGIAKSFNALAAASTKFSQDGQIKDAIFSNIIVDRKDSSVSFNLSASVDPKVVTFSVTSRAAAPSVLKATSTPPVGAAQTTSTSSPQTKKTP